MRRNNFHRNSKIRLKLLLSARTLEHFFSLHVLFILLLTEHAKASCIINYLQYNRYRLSRYCLSRAYKSLYFRKILTQRTTNNWIVVHEFLK